MAIRKARHRAAEDLRQELIQLLGWHAATALIHREAENLRLDPESGAAIRHAYAVHQANRTHPSTPHPEQEPML